MMVTQLPCLTLARQELHQGGREDRVRRMLASRNANGAGRLFPQLAERHHFGLDFLEPRAHAYGRL